MLGQSSNRRLKDLSDRRILLIDRCQATREVRVNVLQSHGVEVHAVEDFSEARFLWQPRTYDFVLFDVRRYPAGEVLEWCEQIKDSDPRQRIAYLVGAPTYLSLTWPGEFIADDASSGQRGETSQKLLSRRLTVLLRPQLSIRLIDQPLPERNPEALRPVSMIPGSGDASCSLVHAELGGNSPIKDLALRA